MDTLTDNSVTSTSLNELHDSVVSSWNRETLSGRTSHDEDSVTAEIPCIDNPGPFLGSQNTGEERLMVNSEAAERMTLETLVTAVPTQTGSLDLSAQQESLEDPSHVVNADVNSLSFQPSIQQTQAPDVVAGTSANSVEANIPEVASDVTPRSDSLTSKITSNFYTAAEIGNGDVLFKTLERVVQETNALPKDVINTPSTSTSLTVLHYTACGGHLDLIKHLLDRGADIDIVDHDGETPLLKAAYHGHLGVVKYLVDNHAFVHHKNNDGCTALHNACATGHLDVVKWFLENTPADVNARNKKNYTPLMNAASGGFLNIVKYLVNETNVDPLIRNDFGEKAYDIAAARMEAQICELLDEVERNVQVNYDTIKHHLTVLIVLYENQHPPQSFLSRLASPRFSLNLLPDIGIHPWTLADGRPSSKETFQLPISGSGSSTEEKWFWLTDWQIDLKHSQVDSEEGWQYAYSFDALENQWYKSPPGTTSNGNWVRRRRWIRAMKRKLRSRDPHQELITEDQENNLVSRPDSLDIEESCNSTQGSDTAAIQTNYHDTGNYSSESRTSRTLENTDINPFYNANAESESHQTPFANRSLARSNTVSVMSGAHLRSTSNANSTTDISLTPAKMNNTSSACILPLSPSLWESDEDAPDCRQCGRRFMIFLRRHHCRRCGLVYCDRCTSTRFPFLVPAQAEGAFSTSYQRVCDTCLALLNSLPKSANSLMSRTNSQASMMNECPVCFASLQSISTERGAQEQHVKECLETRQFSTTPKGSKYLNFKLKEDSNLLGQECPICFEEFELGETIARLTCFCTYHQECIDSWFGRGKQCPFHSG